MTTGDFSKWLEGLMNGTDEQRAKLARPTVTTRAEVIVNGETQKALVACFPAGTFILAIDKAAE